MVIRQALSLCCMTWRTATIWSHCNCNNNYCNTQVSLIWRHLFSIPKVITIARAIRSQDSTSECSCNAIKKIAHFQCGRNKSMNRISKTITTTNFEPRSTVGTWKFGFNSDSYQTGMVLGLESVFSIVLIIFSSYIQQTGR